MPTGEATMQVQRTWNKNMPLEAENCAYMKWVHTVQRKAVADGVFCSDAFQERGTLFPAAGNAARRWCFQSF